VALAFGRVLGSSLAYEVDGRHPLTIAQAAALLGLVSLAACLSPASRASRLDPLAPFATGRQNGGARFSPPSPAGRVRAAYS
jgi:predicted lysophospholipase L1 biosynthesis ABC-type transport system permease subunit